MTSDSMHPAGLGEKQLLSQCEMLRLRRSGPGGQHRNKVETAVVLHHRPTGIRAEANERRSQAENRKVALFRLRVKLALGVRCTISSEDVPTELWRSRCCQGRIHVNSHHQSFPMLLAEALDWLTACEFDPKEAAVVLGCTTSQLVKFLKQEPRALEQLNQLRVSQQMHPLR